MLVYIDADRSICLKMIKNYIKTFSGYLPAILFMCILLSACSKNKTGYLPISSDSNSSAYTDTLGTLPLETNPKIYLALGDSYTIGQSVDSAARFPAQTTAILNRDSTIISGIHYIAATGWTTGNLQAAIGSENLQGPFAAVTLLIGVNDQYQQRDTTNYRERFTRLLNTATSLAGNYKNHVFVVSIPDYGVTPFGANYPGTSVQIDEFNAINKEITKFYRIAYIDVTAISRNDAGDYAMIAPDGLHPSGKQYAHWATALAPVMESGLK